MRARALCLVAFTLLLASPRAGVAQTSSDAFTAATLDGLRFRNIGPANMSGRVVDIAVVDRNPYVFYVAAATGGVWKTVNNGVTFQPVFQHESTVSVGAIAVSQVDPSIVWVGTGERASRQSNSWGDGVYKSTDGGRTWHHMGLRATKEVGRIALDPTNPDIVFVAAMGHLWGPNVERGLYRSTDGGDTWTKVLYVDSVSGVVDVAIDPQDPHVVYAASYQRMRKPYGFVGGGPGSALWKSTDGGDTWRKLGPEHTGVPAQVAAWNGQGQAPTVAGPNGLPEGGYGRIGISIYPKDPRIVYASIEQGYRYNAATAYEARRGGLYRSADGGETWTRMSDWNPRPMYASQPLVDPNDSMRVYMENSISYSDDGGKSFTVMRTSLHGDDRILWVDPSDSRHLILGNDGGLGMSYDRGATWLFVTDLPISQFYHVRTDDAEPYRVYGGLQDNGSWMGPSATYRREGILNEDWTRIGGGDGFLAVPDTTDDDVFYAESQYLGLTRLRRSTLERRDIRPGDPTGHIQARRNSDWFFKGTPVDSLGNAMAPANWNGPYVVSSHDPHVLYAGTDHLWKSTDRGASWHDLGDMTQGMDRREMKIMGQAVGDFVPSLDDGAPYWPTITAIAESPLRAGLLYVGTDDGTLRVSRDGGRTWAGLFPRLTGAPAGGWVAGIEPSAHDTGTVYVVVNNYRNDDYGNYLFRSTDYGQTWGVMTGDLPPERVLRALREDPRNPRVLWLGTEFGPFVSIDAGRHWVSLGAHLPTVPVNDLVIQRRHDDLVLATHGRGVWILDHVQAIQELTPDILRAPAHLFSIGPAAMIRYTADKAAEGDMAFHGRNPPDGAIIDYYLREAQDSGDVVLTVHDSTGARVATLRPSLRTGIDRTVWNLRHDDLPVPTAMTRAGQHRPVPGPFVMPGTYTVQLTVDGQPRGRQTVRVDDDPRLHVTSADRRAWSRDLARIANAYREAVRQLDALQSLRDRLPGAPGAADSPLNDAQVHTVRTLATHLDELFGRARRLYSAVAGWTGPMTADQTSRLAFIRRQLRVTSRRLAGLSAG
ncbi:MAG: glycosyl hydrolase [Gemmatimonadota bacterium]|jgi:photosystem II stability/assembly factor-like uncharacterized protein